MHILMYFDVKIFVTHEFCESSANIIDTRLGFYDRQVCSYSLHKKRKTDQTQGLIGILG